LYGCLARWGIEDDKQSISFQLKQAEGESGPMQVDISYILGSVQRDESQFLQDIRYQSSQTQVLSPEGFDKKVQNQPLIILAKALIPERLQELKKAWNEQQELLRKDYQSYLELATTSFGPETQRRLKKGVSCVGLDYTARLCNRHLSWFQLKVES
jgi:hypothetical protein